MNCKETRDHLSAYLDKALDKDTGTLVERHLNECAACAKEREALEACLAKVRALPKQKAPDDFLQAVHKRIEKTSEPGAFFSLPKMKLPLELAGLMATLLLIVLFSDIVKETRQATDIALLSARFAERTPAAADAPIKTEGKAKATNELVMTPRPATAPAARVLQETKNPLKDTSAINDESRLVMPGTEALGQVRKKSFYSVPLSAACNTVNEGTTGAAPKEELQACDAISQKRSAAKISGEASSKMMERSAPDAPGIESLPLRLIIQGKVTDTTLSRLTTLVERLQGKTLSSGYSAVKIQLPSERYPAFLKELRDFGILRETAPEAASDRKTLSLTILLIENTSR